MLSNTVATVYDFKFKWIIIRNAVLQSTLAVHCWLVATKLDIAYENIFITQKILMDNIFTDNVLTCLLPFSLLLCPLKTLSCLFVWVNDGGEKSNSHPVCLVLSSVDKTVRIWMCWNYWLDEEFLNNLYLLSNTLLVEVTWIFK